jgi:hypothetical protein
VGKLEGKRPLGRPLRRSVDNIKVDLRETGRGYMNWIDLAQDRRQTGRLYILNASIYDHRQVVKWRLHQRSGEVVASDAEKTFYYE